MLRDAASSRIERFVHTSLLVLALSLSIVGCGSTQKVNGSIPAAGASGPAGASGESAPGVVAANVPRHPVGENPFVGAKWWEDPYSQAHLRALRAKTKGDTETALLLGKIAQNGGADWIGEWTPYVERWIDKRITMLGKKGALPYFVAYKIPKRDCGRTVVTVAILPWLL